MAKQNNSDNTQTQNTQESSQQSGGRQPVIIDTSQYEKKNQSSDKTEKRG